MSGNSWDSHSVEGTQNFAAFSSQGDMAQDSEYPFGYGQEPISSRSHIDFPDAFQQQQQQQALSAVGSLSMQRTASRGSTGSFQTGTIRASAHKSRPRIQTDSAVAAVSAAAAAAASHMDFSASAGVPSGVITTTGTPAAAVANNYGLSTEGFTGANSALSSDGLGFFQNAHAVPDSSSSRLLDMQQQYLPVYQQGISAVSAAAFPTEELVYAPDLGLALGGPQNVPQHVDPTCTQMHMDPPPHEASPPATTPNSWESISSRPSSPYNIFREDDLWSQSQPPVSSPTESHGSGTSFVHTAEATVGEDFEDAAATFHQRSDSDTARDHPYYKDPVVHPDGLYHCPWEADASCNHKPEKLKCNYDKFVDSHLKPYRCKHPSCESTRFSSTACLLRHEREAHAMHGHGSKPYLCVYEGCERSQPGNGFPRQWNLKDHMRRVHHDSGSSTASSTTPVTAKAYTTTTTSIATAAATSTSTSASTSTVQEVSKSRKRKKDSSISSHGSATVTASRKSSTKSSTRKTRKSASQTAQEARIQEMEAARKAAMQASYKEMLQHKQALMDVVQGFEPLAPQFAQQIQYAETHLAALSRISTDLNAAQMMDAIAFSQGYLQHTG